MKVWVNTDGEYLAIELIDKAFASGGEGSLYKIKAPNQFTDLIAKIYHPKKRTELRYKKILYLHEHPPKSFEDDLPITLVWPKQLLFDQEKKFIGFLMSFVKGEKLELLCLPKIHKKHRKVWSSYEFEENKRNKKRLDLCYKISKAIYHLHATERYVLVDMKPDNIIVSPNGNIALVDLDSVEVVEEGKTLYDAPVATPEYSPPDSYLSKNEIDPTQEDPWDRFGLGVILYKVLLGVHPYAATSGPPYEKNNSLYQKIEHGLFVHNPDIKKHLTHVPSLHERFYELPLVVQKLFERCFIDGHHNPFARPSSEEWAQALKYYNLQQNLNEEKIKIPPIALEQIPENLNLDKLFVVPTTSIISQEPKLQVEKPIDKEELKPNMLVKAYQNPKEIQSQRFFNFISLLFIVIIGTAFSIILPWPLMLALGIMTYMGINYITYKSRKSADKKDTIFGVLDNQLSYFGELISTAEGYEQKISTYIEKIKNLHIKNPKGYISDFLHKKFLIKEKIENFNKMIQEEKRKLQNIKREERSNFKKLNKYYEEQVIKQTKLPKLEAKTIEQKIILLKRAKRLDKLNAEENIRYKEDLLSLEQLHTQLEIEKLEMESLFLEKSKDILYKCQQKHEELLEDIRIYHQSIGEKEEKEVANLITEQRISLKELERLQYDLKQLEKPLETELLKCRRAKINAELYKKISYSRHLIEMLGIKKPI